MQIVIPCLIYKPHVNFFDLGFLLIMSKDYDIRLYYVICITLHVFVCTVLHVCVIHI